MFLFSNEYHLVRLHNFHNTNHDEIKFFGMPKFRDSKNGEFKISGCPRKFYRFIHHVLCILSASVCQECTVIFRKMSKGSHFWGVHQILLSTSNYDVAYGLCTVYTTPSTKCNKSIVHCSTNTALSLMNQQLQRTCSLQLAQNKHLNHKTGFVIALRNSKHHSKTILCTLQLL